MELQIEIVCVGNELLIGKTLNTNAQYLARQSTLLGASVKRITVVGDEIDEIAQVIREILKRKPHFIITTGGLGPTFDDRTLEGIGKALKRKLKIHGEALNMIQKKYRGIQEGKTEKIELTPARMKMATLPEDSKPLPNPVGTAPGVMINIGRTIFAALPGVPPEMEAIFMQSLKPLFEKGTGHVKFFERSVYVEHIMESSLAPIIDSVMADNPTIYIKSHVYTQSHPPFSEGKTQIELHFSTKAKSEQEAQAVLKRAVGELTQLIEKNKGRLADNRF